MCALFTMTSNGAVVEFQCFVDDCNNYIVKELAIFDLKYYAASHWIFKPPSHPLVIRSKTVRTNCWLSKNYHRIRWEQGDISYRSLPDILHDVDLNYKYVFVKGQQKKDFLLGFLHSCEIINIEEYKCPRVDKMESLQITPCITHKDLKLMCSYYRSHILAQWVYSNYDLIFKFL